MKKREWMAWAIFNGKSDLYLRLDGITPEIFQNKGRADAFMTKHGPGWHPSWRPVSVTIRLAPQRKGGRK